MLWSVKKFGFVKKMLKTKKEPGTAAVPVAGAKYKKKVWENTFLEVVCSFYFNYITLIILLLLITFI